MPSGSDPRQANTTNEGKFIMSVNWDEYDRNGWLHGNDVEKLLDEQELDKLPATVSLAYEQIFPSGDKSIVLEFFELEQKLSLNKGRRDKMRVLFGDDLEQWLGKQIFLSTTDVVFQGKTTLGIVISGPPRQRSKQAELANPEGDVLFDRKGS